MIVIDAREGISSDMLLGAMLEGLDGNEKARLITALSRTCESRGIAFHVMDVEEDGDKGIGIAYQSNGLANPGSSRTECFERLAEIERDLGSRSAVAKDILGRIFVAEAEAHGIPEEEVHLHEIARTQALVNMAGIGLVASILLQGPDDGFSSSVITTGGGLVVMSHGAIRIPAPASAILLRGLRHVFGDSPGERATPTGIAAIRALAKSQVDSVPSAFRRRTVGFGTKRFSGRLGRTALLWV